MSESDQSTPTVSAPSTAPTSALADAQAASRPSGRLGRILLVVVLLLAIALGVGLYEQNRQYRVLKADFEQQHSQNAQLARETSQQAEQALSLARAQAAQVGDLRSALDDTSSQVQELDQALQLMTDSGSDLLLLNDIDHLVTIAQQQLSLGGNVANAIISLEAAQAQLARANRPGLAALQQSINGDIDRLRAVATINVAALSAQLDQLSDWLGSAPLLMPDTATAMATAPTTSSPVQASTVAPAASAHSNSGWQAALQDSWTWVQGAGQQVVHDLKKLFDIRRVDDSAALLMSPDQAQRFREGLKQRAITAQLALMMHQSKIWKSELARIAQALDQRYDMRAETARQALKLARSLHDTTIEISLPTVDNSLAAIAAARDVEAAQEAAPEAAPDPSEGTNPPAVQSPATDGAV
ncbi:uroporphyrinogen-III C-methyltransferase [Castellaniella sp.]|uniref:uroporphyrinogen-III C-methyltransferase n=1 Tax=Castellaniella sp. TaxID=1955812 RepID=UPI003A900D9D